MTINEIQDEIINEFSMLEGDREMSQIYVIELGRKLPVMPLQDKSDQNLVKGCLSKVWLTGELNEGKIEFKADSNTEITKGLISLLIRIFNYQSPEDILNSELYFIKKIGMDRFIGTQRTGGLAAMINKMRYYALAFKTKMEV